MNNEKINSKIKLSNNSSFIISIFEVSNFRNTGRSIFCRYKFWLPPNFGTYAFDKKNSERLLSHTFLKNDSYIVIASMGCGRLEVLYYVHLDSLPSCCILEKDENSYTQNGSVYVQLWLYIYIWQRAVQKSKRGTLSSTQLNLIEGVALTRGQETSRAATERLGSPTLSPW